MTRDPLRYVSPKNARSTCGVEWRWLVEVCAEHGVAPMRVKGKRLLRAVDVDRVLAAAAEQEQPQRSETDAEVEARVLRELGLERKAG